MSEVPPDLFVTFGIAAACLLFFYLALKFLGFLGRVLLLITAAGFVLLGVWVATAHGAL